MEAVTLRSYHHIRYPKSKTIHSGLYTEEAALHQQACSDSNRERQTTKMWHSI